MRAALALLPLLLAACEGRQVVSICAAVGDPAGEIRAAFHDADGLRAVLSSDAATGQSTIARDNLETPVLPELWRLAEATMRALREDEASPCGLDTRSTVTVTFADGESLTRETSCTGNALSRVANGVLAAAEGAPAPEPAGDAVTDIAQACARLP
jgi:hypothetical protein